MLPFQAVVTHLFRTSNFICSRSHPPLLFSGLGPLFLLFILLFSCPILVNFTRGAWRLFPSSVINLFASSKVTNLCGIIGVEYGILKQGFHSTDKKSVEEDGTCASEGGNVHANE